MADIPVPSDYSSDSILQAVRDGALEALMAGASLALEGDRWQEFARAGIALHRSGELDMVAAILASDGPVDWSAEAFYSAALPEIDMPVGTMFQVIGKFAARSHDGDTPYFMYDVLASWAGRSTQRVSEALELIRNGKGPRAMMVAVLQAGLVASRSAYVSRIAELLLKGSSEDARAAGRVLGAMTPADADERQLIAATLDAALNGVSEEQQLAAFDASLSIGTRTADNEEFAQGAFAAIGSAATPQLREAAARALFMTGSTSSGELVSLICNFLEGVEAGEKTTIKAIDRALCSQRSPAISAPRLALLNSLLKREISDLQEMEGTAHHILADKNGLLQALVTQWVADGSDAMVDAVCHLTLKAAGRGRLLDLDFSKHALCAEQTIAIACKVTGRLLAFPRTAVSIVLSLMRSGHPEAGDELEELLFDPLLINYWKPVREVLTDLAPPQPDRLQVRIERLKKRIDAHTAAINEVGVIKELRPSERQYFLREILRSEESRQISKDVQKNSPFMEIFPPSVLLYGDSAVSAVFKSEGESERREFRLGSFEHKSDLARMKAIDPVGFWYDQLVLCSGELP